MAQTVQQQVIERARRNFPNTPSTLPKFGTFGWMMYSMNNISAPANPIQQPVDPPISPFGVSYVVAAVGSNQFNQLGI